MAYDPFVYCIVLNWNGWKDTVVCLAALRQVDYPRLSVLVVDNGSTDASVENIRKAFPEVEIIENQENAGFGAGNNLGIRLALQRDANFIWLLNNDAVPDPGALKALLRKAALKPRAGAIGSVLSYAHDPSLIQAWGGGRVNIWLGRAMHAKEPREDHWFDYLTAASVLLRSSVLKRVGLFDEDFFLYWEDTDLGFRIRKAGAMLSVAEDSRVLHKENASTGRGTARQQRYTVSSGIRFLIKHAPQPWLSVPLYIAFEFAKNVLKMKPAQIRGLIGGVGEYFSRQRYLKGIRRA
jgi:GT2 family glycosyltransferase